MDIVSRRMYNLLLLALLVTTTISLSRTQLPERRPELSKYQDAWKAITVPGRYYLYMRSYEDEPFYGFDSKCVSTELNAINEKEKYTVNTFRSINAKDGKRTNRTVYAWTRTTEGYPSPNVIESSLTVERDYVLEIIMAYSEYRNCDIVRIPYRNNACELWAKEGEINDIQEHCFFIFNLLCGPNNHIVYDSQLCEA